MDAALAVASSGGDEDGSRPSPEGVLDDLGSLVGKSLMQVPERDVQAVLTSSTGGMPLHLVDDARRLGGVAHASALVSSTGYLEPDDEDARDREVPLQGISPDGAAYTLSVPLRDGTLSDLRGDAVALSAQHDLGRGVGDTISMRLGDGAEIGLTVVAVFFARPGFETALVPASLLVEHTTTGLVPQILVRAAPAPTPRA